MGTISKEFQLSIYSQSGLIFDQPVVAISAENEVGPLSILAGHSNFITTINGSLTTEMLFAYFKDGSTKGFLLESGVIKVFENKAEVFLVLDLNLNLASDKKNSL